MEEKIHSYENDEIKVTYDLNRCIHAAECVKGLRSVFNPEKRPWIQPENASADQIAEVVQRCPTGALHFERKDQGEPEHTPPANSISFTADGPIYLKGNIRVVDADDTTILEDSRVALCHCGFSNNKPVCDNTHKKENFEAPTAFRTDRLTKDDEGDSNGVLNVQLMENGPYIVDGKAILYSDSMQPRACSGRMALCRCGGSKNKPFCDGTHKSIGFEG
jgi:CDGSH-type Zn-finger protein/uncharacterized Fe-S cluster protein YjdI